MSGYPELKRVELSLADVRRLTALEWARVLVLAGVSEREVNPLLTAVAKHRSTPAEFERGMLLFYAMAWQLGRRADPALEWAAVQAWDVRPVLDSKLDPMAEAEAAASVHAALATGLPPAAAGELTLAQLDVYRETREQAAKSASRPRARRARG